MFVAVVVVPLGVPVDLESLSLERGLASPTTVRSQAVLVTDHLPELGANLQTTGLFSFS